MAGDERNLGGLTRALLLGAAVGTLPLVQVGCAVAPSPAPSSAPSPAPSPTPMVNPALATDQELCARVLSSRSARDAEVLLRNYPGAGCVPPALAALPPSALAAISPSALAQIPPAMRVQIPAETARYLRFQAGEVTEPVDYGTGGRGVGPY
jgi:hypothetical protein